MYVELFGELSKLSDKSLAKITALEDNVSLTHGNGWCDKVGCHAERTYLADVEDLSDA